MKAKTILLIIFSLALVFSLFSCKREAIEEPSPFGPSTYAVVLNVSASPNVIFAGDIREATTITARLKKFDGVPLANKTIYFEIGDEAGNKVNVGNFEGYESVIAKVTNSNGVATVNYAGPFAQELTANATIYIWATVAGEGKDLIIEMTPVQIIKYPTDLIFEVVASPNVLYATSTRPESTIAALVKIGSTLVKDRKVYFTITAGPGEFSDDKRRTFAYTDQDGIATVIYIGPTKDEIAGDLFVTIKSQPETTTPVYIHKEIDIRILKAQ